MQESYDYILEKSREWIKEKYKYFSLNLDLLKIEDINNMFCRVISIDDVASLCDLVHLTYKFGKFSEFASREKRSNFIFSWLKPIAEQYIFSNKCLADFQMVLEDALKCDLIINEMGKAEKNELYEIAAETKRREDKYFRKLEKRVEGIESKVQDLEKRIGSLETDVKEIRSSLIKLAKAMQEEKEIGRIVNCINLGLNLIPAIGPIAAALNKALIDVIKSLITSTNLESISSLGLILVQASISSIQISSLRPELKEINLVVDHCS